MSRWLYAVYGLPGNLRNLPPTHANYILLFYLSSQAIHYFFCLLGDCMLNNRVCMSIYWNPVKVNAKVYGKQCWRICQWITSLSIEISIAALIDVSTNARVYWTQNKSLQWLWIVTSTGVSSEIIFVSLWFHYLLSIEVTITIGKLSDFLLLTKIAIKRVTTQKLIFKILSMYLIFTTRNFMNDGVRRFLVEGNECGRLLFEIY